MHTARKVLGAGCWVLACAWQTSWCAATTAPLAIVNPTVSDRDGGAAVPGSYPHDPGETMFFSFQVDGYTASSGDRVHLTYKMDALDPNGVPLMDPVAAEIEETLAPEDKNWKPTVRHEIIIPPLAGSGTYKIAISVTDLIAKATATKEVPFEVHGRRSGAQRHAGDPQYPLLSRRRKTEKLCRRPPTGRETRSGRVSISSASNMARATPSTSATR